MANRRDAVKGGLNRISSTTSSRCVEPPTSTIILISGFTSRPGTTPRVTLQRRYSLGEMGYVCGDVRSDPNASNCRLTSTAFLQHLLLTVRIRSL